MFKGVYVKYINGYFYVVNLEIFLGYSFFNYFICIDNYEVVCIFFVYYGFLLKRWCYDIIKFCDVL